MVFVNFEGSFLQCALVCFRVPDKFFFFSFVFLKKIKLAKKPVLLESGSCKNDIQKRMMHCNKILGAITQYIIMMNDFL